MNTVRRRHGLPRAEIRSRIPFSNAKIITRFTARPALLRDGPSATHTPARSKHTQTTRRGTVIRLETNRLVLRCLLRKLRRAGAE